MKIFGSIVLVFTLFFSTAADVRSEMLMQDYLKSKDTTAVALYLQGILDGLSWANAHLRNKKLPLLFCEPEQFSLNVFNLKQIVDAHYERNGAIYKKTGKEIHLSTIAFFALEETFPCN